MILLLDNYDSFTYNLVDYFARLHVEVQVLRNDTPFEEIIAQDYQGIVLSPGPGKPEDAGQLMRVIEYYHKRKPILGICLGHQAIGQFFGASLSRASYPMHGKISQIRHLENHALYQGVPKVFKVVRYHSLVLNHLPDCLEVTALTEAGEIMAMKHKTLPIHGIQYHPEAILTEYGMKILTKWIDLYKISN